jgi:hypothetical protein
MPYKNVIEENIKGRTEVTERRERRRKHPLMTLKKRKDLEY